MVVVPEHDRPRLDVTVRGRRVTVRLVPRLPLGGLTDSLAATSTADAGPAPQADGAARAQPATTFSHGGGSRLPPAFAESEPGHAA